MTADLDHIDLESLVRGTQPHPSLMERLEKAGMGYDDAIHGWIWRTSKLMNLTEKQLYNTYIECKKAWSA